MKYNNFIDSYNAKMSKSYRTVFIILGLILLSIDGIILYALYISAIWLNELLTAPGIFTIILLLIGIIIFGSILVTLLIFGIIGLYVGIIG